MLAYREGCKGITIYRDGSRVGQVLTAGTGSEVKEASAQVEAQQIAGRPEMINSKTIKQQSPFGNMYITIGEVTPGDPFEVFATIGKAGSDVQAVTEAVCRSISQLLRLASDVPRRDRLQLVIDQFSGIGGYATAGFGPDRVRSIPDAVAKAMRRYLYETQGAPAPLALPTVSAAPAVVPTYTHASGALCGDCGQASVYMAEGCMTCQECGWSQC
jgi:ribonucleoside-diphosphate reductase alpha chain